MNDDIKEDVKEKEVKEKHKDHKKNAYVEGLEKEIASLKEQVLLGKAELINYRKRKDEETSNRLKYACNDLLGDLILVLDNFERAINLDDNNLSDELSSFLKGFKMIYVELSEIVKRSGVVEIDALHKPFDPSKEEALMVESDINYPNDEVLDVLLKGYLYKDRILRAASCKVNKIEEKNNEKEEND